MKKLLLLFVVAMLTLSLIGCQSQDALSVFERAATNELTLMNRFEATEIAEVTDDHVDQLSLGHVQQLSVTISSEDMSNLEKIAYIKSLFRDIKITHAHNILIRYENQDTWAILKSNVQVFRDANLSLTEDDQTTLLSYKTEFGIRRLEVMETIGDIKDLLLELKGLYDLDHLDLIINNFESILDILEMRYDHMLFVQTALVEVNTIVESYFTE